MAHGFSAVKECTSTASLKLLPLRDSAALVFDNRNFGASGGEPRQESIPGAGQRLSPRDHLRETLPETDAARIGIWGSSYCGGHVLVGAIDRRVKASSARFR